jgi:hypothetical protein
MGNRVLAAGRQEGQEPFDLTLETEGLVQVATALRASHGAPLDRGNRTTTLRFTVSRRHPSLAAASEFLLRHSSGLVSLEGTLTLLDEEGAEPDSFHLSHAVLRRVRGTQEGTTTAHAYEVIGGALEADAGEGAS